MKITKKVTSLLLVLLLALSTCAVAITASAVPSLPDGPVNLYIHKYLNYSDATPDVDQSTIGLTNQTGEVISEIPATAKPINGITFKITRCGDINAKVVDDTQEPGKAGNPSRTNKTFIKTTDKVDGQDGIAKFEINSADYGLYYVEEIDGTEDNKTKDDYDFIKYRAKSFWVYVPMTKPDGTGWMDKIHTYPKNVYTTGAAAAVKSIDETTYISRLQELRIFDGAVIELHKETSTYKAATDDDEASGEKVIAKFGLAYTSNNPNYKPDHATDYKTGADAEPTAVNVAWVQIGEDQEDLSNRKYASSSTFGGIGSQTAPIKDTALAVNGQWDSFGYLSAIATPKSDQVSENAGAEFGIEFSNLKATVTNDGKMIVTGLPAGNYHWHESEFTRLYAAEANDYGGGLQNKYTEWRECGSLTNKKGIIGDPGKITIDGLSYGNISINDESHDFTFTGSAKEDELNKIENTVGIQIDKETNDESPDHMDTFVSNDEGMHQDEDCFDYSVGSYVPYRLDIKLPKDNQLKNSAVNTITFTDTLSNGLKLQNDGEAYEARRFKGTSGSGLNNTAATGYSNDNGLTVNPTTHKQAFTFMVSYAEVTTISKDFTNHPENYSGLTADQVVGKDGGHVNVTEDILAADPLVNIKVDGQKSIFEITSEANYTAIMALFNKLYDAAFMETKTPVLEIYYDAQITKDAVVSTNDKTFSDTNGNANTFKLDFGTQTEEQKAYVFTGGAKLVKYDANTFDGSTIDAELQAGRLLTGMQGVNGAKYQVFPGKYESKEALLTAINDDDKPIKPIVFAKKTSGADTVYVRDEDQDTDIGDGSTRFTDLTTVTNGGQVGSLWFAGLKFGEYTVVEVVSPKSTSADSVGNYELSNVTYPIVVDATSYAKSRSGDYLPDVPTPQLPLTGGIGTTIFIVVGLVLIGGAVFFFIRSRKRKEEEV